MTPYFTTYLREIGEQKCSVLIEIAVGTDHSIPTAMGLLADFGDDAGADRLATLADGEVAADVEGDRFVETDGDAGVVARNDQVVPWPG